MEELAQHPLSESLQEKLQGAITYFSNNQHQWSMPTTAPTIFPSVQG
jgi:hypothetical protein